MYLISPGIGDIIIVCRALTGPGSRQESLRIL